MFSQEWETRFSEGKSACNWPWSDLITYNSKYGYTEPEMKVLELGPGVGANIPYFLSLNFDYYAIEGSKTAVAKIHKAFPSLKDRVILGDFTKEIPFDNEFDLIVDRSSLTHNNTKSISHCLKLIANKLTPFGKYIGIDWFSWSHGERPFGDLVDDLNTYTFRAGKFSNCGKVHFSTKAHLLEMFKDAGLTITLMDHKIFQTHRLDSIEDSRATWNIVAKRIN